MEIFRIIIRSNSASEFNKSIRSYTVRCYCVNSVILPLRLTVITEIMFCLGRWCVFVFRYRAPLEWNGARGHVMGGETETENVRYGLPI